MSAVKSQKPCSARRNNLKKGWPMIIGMIQAYKRIPLLRLKEKKNNKR
jgi:hypothetical protein